MNIKRDANKREHQQADALGMTRCAGSGACIICGSKYNVRNNLCNKHYLQVYRHGKILTRTIYDCNEIVKYDKHAEIILYDNNCNEVARTKIDLEDIERCSKHKWCLAVKGYVVSFIDGAFNKIPLYLTSKSPNL